MVHSFPQSFSKHIENIADLGSELSDRGIGLKGGMVIFDLGPGISRLVARPAITRQHGGMT